MLSKLFTRSHKKVVARISEIRTSKQIEDAISDIVTTRPYRILTG